MPEATSLQRRYRRLARTLMYLSGLTTGLGFLLLCSGNMLGAMNIALAAMNFVLSLQNDRYADRQAQIDEAEARIVRAVAKAKASIAATQG